MEKKIKKINPMSIAKKYEPKKVEEKWYKHWLKSNLFSPDITSSKLTYTMVIPPPNITGVLHMGHALNITLQDILIRWNRMQGKKVLWVPGTDHAGIATQNVVERDLKKEGLTKEEIGVESFIKKVWEWKKTHGETITKQLKKLGASCDWNRESFTMDPHFSSAVRKCFYELYHKQLIYKGTYLTQSCPHCQTVLSDEECERKLLQGMLYHIRYPIANSDDFIEIATTRPETMLGDGAIARNPNDTRYKHLKTLSVIVPLIDRVIPIIEDDYVDPQFGTGLVKITPAHDPNDFLLGKKHRIPPINILTNDGKITNTTLYNGLDRFECRKQILKDLKKKGFLVKTTPHEHHVGHCYRCFTIVEPRVSKQWFVRMDLFAEKALEAQTNKDIVFYPKRWEKVYTHWLTNIKNWCISRQIWWGHRIPVWYCSDCQEEIVEIDTPQVCPICNSHNIFQDPDVLDTWFSSWLWPLASLGWPEKGGDWETLYPTQTLVTGSDILYFWVARMIMSGIEFTNKLPFKHVYLHGIIRDNNGLKMSKSLKNVIDPLAIIDEFSADSLRYSLVLLSTSSQDIRISKETFLMGHHFSNKIWNAFRFLDMNYQTKISFSPTLPPMNDLISSWIHSRFMTMLDTVNTSLSTFRFQDASKAIYDFLWHDFCDWYLEIIKNTIKDDSNVQHFATVIFANTLKVLHPFMPFITEEIWQKLPITHEQQSIMISPWPSINFSKISSSIEEQFSLFKTLVQSIRNARKELGIAFSQKLDIVIVSKKRDIKKKLALVATILKKIATLSSISFKASFKPSECRVIVLEYGTVYIKISGLIDLEKERTRLNKALEKMTKELSIYQEKLSNKTFMKKAPQQIIAQYTEKKANLEKMKNNLNFQIMSL